jgi:PIN domain nuclease of toxin-antitoxin system
VKLLLDTHLMLWWQAGDARLPLEVRRLAKAAQAVYFSRASLWEMAIKISLGRLRVDLPAFCQQIESQGFRWLDIRNEHLCAVATLPTYDDHRDPFDRLLVAQSLTEPLLLLTADAALNRYGSTIRIV